MRFDRPHLQSDYNRETTSVAIWLVCAIAGAFIIQFAADSRWLASGAGLTRELAFSVEGLAAGRFWTPLTHWLLHSTSNLFHVGVVLTALLLLGRQLVGDLGARRFIGVFAGSIMSGAILWGALNRRTGCELTGSIAGVYGLVAVYALLHPNRKIRFLFFFFPVTFRPKYLAAAMFLTDLLALVLVDLLGRTLPFSYAPSAHLGGMLAGCTYFQLFHQPRWLPSQMPRAETCEEASSQMAVLPPNKKEDPTVASGPSRVDIRTQVDRVLDKINSQGFGALTPDERRILDEAKDLLSRR